MMKVVTEEPHLRPTQAAADVLSRRFKVLLVEDNAGDARLIREEFGQERLLLSVREKATLPANQIFDELLGEIQQFSLTKDFDDDLCLAGVEVKRLGVQH